MRTVNFKTGVLNPLIYLLGLRPSIVLPEKGAALINFINQRLTHFYDRADFPEWTTTEQRTPDASHIVEWEQSGQTALGKVFRVYLQDPTSMRSGPLDTPFRLTPAGVHVGTEHGSFVWIKYLPRVEQWPTDLWSATLDYEIGDTRYYPTSGEAYRKTATAIAGTLPTDDSVWTVLPFPWALATPVIRGAFADALRDDGQNEKAAAEEQFAEMVFGQRLGIQARQNSDLLTDQEGRARRYHSPVAA